MGFQPFPVDAGTIAAFQRDGAVCIRGAFKDWVGVIAAGIDRNMREKSATASDIVQDGKGSFFDDYCNWERIPEFVTDGARIAGRADRRRGDGIADRAVLS